MTPSSACRAASGSKVRGAGGRANRSNSLGSSALRRSVEEAHGVLLVRLLVVVLEERSARPGVPLDGNLVLARQHQGLRVRHFLRGPGGVAVGVERPVVSVGADRQDELVRRGSAQILARGPGDGFRRGDRSRIVVGRVLVVGHQHQEVAGSGEPLDGYVFRVRGQVHRHQEPARVELAPQRLDEQRQLLETLGAQLLEVQVDAGVTPLLADAGQLARRVPAQRVRGQHGLGEIRRKPVGPVVGHGGHHLEALRRLQDARVLLDGELASGLEADPLRHHVRELVGVLLQGAQAGGVPVHHERSEHRRRAGAGAALALRRLRLLQERPEPTFFAVVGGLARAPFERVPRRQRAGSRHRRRLREDLAPARPRSQEDRHEEGPGGRERSRSRHHRGQPDRRASPS